MTSAGFLGIFSPMFKANQQFTRRNFLKLTGTSALAFGSLAFRPLQPWAEIQAQFPDVEKMGRVAQGMVKVRAKPYVDGAVTKTIYDDAIVAWLREVVGEAPDGYGSSRWVETPDGYIYAPRLQPVWNHPNQPVKKPARAPRKYGSGWYRQRHVG